MTEPTKCPRCGLRGAHMVCVGSNTPAPETAPDAKARRMMLDNLVRAEHEEGLYDRMPEAAPTDRWYRFIDDIESQSSADISAGSEAAPVSAGEREAFDLHKWAQAKARDRGFSPMTEDFACCVGALMDAYAAGRASLQSELDEALSLLEPASGWMSADEIDWWNRYARLRKEVGK